MNVEIVSLVRAVRGKKPRDLVPGALQRGVQTFLQTGNNLGIPREDFVALCWIWRTNWWKRAGAGFRFPWT